MANEQSDYFVYVWRSGNGDVPWNWQICRRSIPMGVQICAKGYTNRMSAKAAGTKALADLLKQIDDYVRKSEPRETVAKSGVTALQRASASVPVATGDRKRGTLSVVREGRTASRAAG